MSPFIYPLHDFHKLSIKSKLLRCLQMMNQLVPLWSFHYHEELSATNSPPQFYQTVTFTLRASNSLIVANWLVVRLPGGEMTNSYLMMYCALMLRTLFVPVQHMRFCRFWRIWLRILRKIWPLLFPIGGIILRMIQNKIEVTLIPWVAGNSAISPGS